LRKIITTAVVLITDEMLADTIINAGVKRRRGRILSFFISWVSHSMTPLSSKPMAMIISDSMVITAGLEKPLIASSGVVRFKRTKETMIKKAILSIGKYSVTKRITVQPMTIKTKSIGISIIQVFN